MKKVYVLFLVGLLIMGFNCDNDLASEVEIRLKNVGMSTYTDIKIGNNHTYDDIAPGETTDYQVYEEAYRYAYVSLEVNDEVYILQPIDFVGETKLENGKYTYELEAVESNGMRIVYLNFVED